MFNKRATQLLNILLTKKTAITGRNLANRLNVSNRTIRSDIAQINMILLEEGVEIKSTNPYGYYIEESDKTTIITMMEQDAENDESFYVPNTPSDRIAYIVLRLIFHNDFISMNNLADELYVSKATINQSVKQLSASMQKRKTISLESSSTGIRLLGKEYEQRIFVSNFLNKQDKSIDYLMKMLSFIEPENLDIRTQVMDFYQAVIQQIETYGMFLTDKEVHSLVIYMLITVKRIRLHCDLQLHQKEEGIDDLTMGIAENAVTIFRIGFTKAEVLAIQERLAGRRIMNAIDLQQDDPTINKVIDNFLTKVYEKYGLNFSNHENLHKFLYLHIKPMLHRLRRQEEEDNPLKDAIKKKFPLAIEISFLLQQEVKDIFHLQMNDSEISYIALHIATSLEILNTPTRIIIVSHFGASSLQLMKIKISNHFTNKVNVLGCYTVYQYDSMMMKAILPNCDLIISTSSLPKDLPCPQVIVNPLIMHEDFANIKRYIHYYAMDFKDKGKFLNLFDKDLFVILEEPYSYYEIIHKLVQIVYDKQIIDDTATYYDLVIQREEAYSTIMDNYIAIPHASENIAHNTVIATAILRKQIEHKGKKVALVLLNVTSVNEDLQMMYTAIEKMFEIENVEPLIQCESYENFIHLLK